MPLVAPEPVYASVPPLITRLAGAFEEIPRLLVNPPLASNGASIVPALMVVFPEYVLPLPRVSVVPTPPLTTFRRLLAAPKMLSVSTPVKVLLFTVLLTVSVFAELPELVTNPVPFRASIVWSKLFKS